MAFGQDRRQKRLLDKNETSFRNDVNNMVRVGHPRHWIMLDEAIMRSAPEFVFLRDGPKHKNQVI